MHVLRRFVFVLAVAGMLLGFHSLGYGAVSVSGTRTLIGYWGYNLHYKENAPDKDTAWMNGVMLKMERVGSGSGVLRTYSWLNVGCAFANGIYDGNGQGPVVAPIVTPTTTTTTTTTDAHITTNTVEVMERGEMGFGLAQVFRKMVLKESVVIGGQLWRRKIRGGYDDNGNYIKGYEEDFLNFYGGLQLEDDFYFSRHFFVGAVVMGAVSPKNGNFNFAYNSKYQEDYKMGVAYRWKVAMPVGYSLGAFTFYVEPFYSGWKFHKSDVVDVTTSTGVQETYEPSSTTEETGVFASVGFRF